MKKEMLSKAREECADSSQVPSSSSSSSAAARASSSFAVGARVEARRNSSFEDCDVLYYEATVTAAHRMPWWRPSQRPSSPSQQPLSSSSPSSAVVAADVVTHYSLHFEDDCPQAMVPAAGLCTSSNAAAP